MEQIRNGSATTPLTTGAWASGSLNASQAHYAENWSIPYRLVITGLAKNSDISKPHTVIIEWDTKHSDKNALDFITHYNNMDYTPGTHFFNFNHNQEAIDPTDGYNNLANASDFGLIPPPPVPGDPNGSGDNPAKTFKALQSIQKDRMYIYGGSNITFGGYTTTDATMQLEIKFINPNSTTVILAWGGHIAYYKDYAGNSASTISGSPYHMRLVSLNGSGGNQDRALSADAVADPPACSIAGKALVECKTTNTYTATIENYDPNLTYDWVVYDITKDPPVVLVTQSATINNGISNFNYTAGTCGQNYRVAFIIKKGTTPLPSCAPVDVTVVDTEAPTWTTAENTLDRTLECDDVAGLAAAQALAPVATDKCSTPALTKTPGTFTKGSCSQAGTYTNTWVAKDPCGNISAKYTQVITIVDTKAPTWTTAEKALDKTLECNDAAGLAAAQALAPVATDNCGKVTYEKTAGSFVVGTCPQAGKYTNTWVAKDECTNTSTVFTQVITIVDTKAPTWTTAEKALDKTLECNDAAGLAAAQALAPVATDNCGKVTYEKTAGSFVASEDCPQGGTITNTWIAKDECTNTSTVYTQVITIVDTKAPTWTTAEKALDKTLECNDAAGLAAAQALAPVATDNCGKVTYEKTAGSFVVGTCPQAGKYTNTWVAKDECTNTSTVFTQIITIKDSKAPEIKVQAAGETVECDGQGNTATFESWLAANGGASAIDACGPVSWSNNYNVGNWVVDCGNAKHISVTFTAKDECGNTATTSATFTIQDKTGPKLEGCPEDRVIECLNELNTVANVTALDACSGKVPVKFTQIESNKGNGCSNIITRIWEAKDACGNTSSCKQVITLVDKTAPAIVCSPDIQLPCTLEQPTKEQSGIPTVYDFCDAAPVVTFQDETIGTGCDRIIKRTWTAIDAKLNKSTCVQTITFTSNSNLVQKVSTNQTQKITTGTSADQQALKTDQPTSEMLVKAFPNPFFSSVNFQFVSPVSGKATLEIFDLLGRRLAIGYEGVVEAGTPVSFTYNIADKNRIPLIYKLSVGESSVRGKLLPDVSGSRNEP